MSVLQRYLLVDVLRGIAALLVLVLHVIVLGDWKSFPSEGLLRGFHLGWIGVDIFFVISGFVIGLTVLKAVRGDDTQGAKLGWRYDFALRRLRRIVPLYLLTSLAFVWLVDPSTLLQGWKFATLNVASHLLFVHNLHPMTGGAINGVSWSIGVEMQFYLLMMLCAGWLARASIWRIVLVFSSCALLWRFATTLVLPPGASQWNLQLFASSQLPGTLDAFGFGIVLAKLAVSGRMGASWSRFALWSIAAALLVTLAWRTFWPHAGYWDVTPMIIGWRTLVAAAAAAVLAALVVCPIQGSWLLRPPRYLGEISYGIYLWHPMVVVTLMARTPWRGIDLLLGTLAGTILLSAFCWHVLEKPWLTNHKAVSR